MRELLNKKVENWKQMLLKSQVCHIAHRSFLLDFCVDYRKLNRITVFDANPMPSANNIHAKLSGDKYFSKIDLSKGCWQIKMDTASKDKTEVSTPDGLYNFKTMPFGLVCAPAVFTKLMRTLLKWLDNYIDHSLIHTASFDDHVKV